MMAMTILTGLMVEKSPGPLRDSDIRLKFKQKLTRKKVMI